MQSVRQFMAAGEWSPVIRIGVRALSTSDSASLKKNVASILDSLSLVPGTKQVLFVCFVRKWGKDYELLGFFSVWASENTVPYALKPI